MTTKEPRIIHPFIIAMFPVVFLYSHNISEVIASQMILAFTFLAWFLLGLIFKNKHVKGLLLSTFLLYFFTCGHFYIKFMDAYIGQWKVGIHTWLLPFWSYNSDGSADFFTAKGGNCQRLPNGNTLISQTQTGRAFEVNRDGKIVW